MMMKSADLGTLRMSYRDTGGDGPVIVLLHGWPQTSQCWDGVTPALAEDFRVIAPDLRGYGHTDKPRDGYDKLTMADDIRQLLEALGQTEVRMVGHDRGARVAHRFALDHSSMLTHLTLLDVAPTLHTFRNGTITAARNYWHWLFHMNEDLPELLVGGSIEAYLRFFFERWTVQRHAVEAAIPDYVTAFARPGALRAGFDDYRATDIDLAHDAHDHDRGVVVDMPVQLLWGDHGLVGGIDVIEAWKAFAPNAFGGPLVDCGHFIPEEQPEELVRRLLAHHRS